jgi:hypothetical protein
MKEKSMTDPKFLEHVRAAIGAKNIPKKVLARRCRVSRPQFSEMIHGDREMPEEVKKRLLKELDLRETLEMLRTSAELLH